MDKVGSVLKGGWHPSGDKEIHRKTWKSDLKNMATGKKDDGATRAQSHVSAPLTTLKDPDSFGPPPKHSAYYGETAGALTAPPTASWSNVSQKEPEAKAPQGPYRVDTTGLRTDNLPPPPGRNGPGTPTTAAAPRPVPALPARKATAPPPALPPRQTDTPNEYTPAPPPTYGEATTSPALNQAAIGRLSSAGVSVPGLGIGSSQSNATQPDHSGQLSELQQRFARMNANRSEDGSSNATSVSPSTVASAVNAGSHFASLAAARKPPPPLPPKKTTASDQSQAPPIPMSSKPRPG